MKSKQEGLANAKVNVQQFWRIGRHSTHWIAQQYQRNLYIVEIWKVLSVRNNSLADNAGLSLFI